jgi:hypothetical protein
LIVKTFGIRPHGLRSVCAGRTTLQISVYGPALFGDLIKRNGSRGLRPASRPTFTELYSESMVYRRLSPVEPPEFPSCGAWGSQRNLRILCLTGRQPENTSRLHREPALCEPDSLEVFALRQHNSGIMVLQGKAHGWASSARRCGIYVRGKENVHKKFLIQAAACNLALLMRSTYGSGKPRAAHDAAVDAILTILAVMTAVEEHFSSWFADSDNEVEIVCRSERCRQHFPPTRKRPV